MEITDVIQFISFPLESIGFVITITEVFSPKHHSKMQLSLQKTLDLYVELVNKRRWILFITTDLLLLPAITAILLETFSIRIGGTNLITSSLIYFSFLLLIGFFSFAALNTLFKNSRNLLALGITLSVLGLFGESVQFFKLFF